MNLDDYTTRESFSAQELEHILQIPLTELVELLTVVPRAGGGRFQGDGSRKLVRKLARGRLFADLIARQAANADPVISRGPDSGDPDIFNLVNASTGEELQVRFSGDLVLYLERQKALRGPEGDTLQTQFDESAP